MASGSVELLAGRGGGRTLVEGSQSNRVTVHKVSEATSLHVVGVGHSTLVASCLRVEMQKQVAEADL